MHHKPEPKKRGYFIIIAKRHVWVCKEVLVREEEEKEKIEVEEETEKGGWW